MTTLVVVGGWGIPTDALASILPEGMEPLYLEPARMAMDHATLASALEAVIGETPRGACWLGWSLGGQVAMAAQQRFPEHVSSVVTLCSTPRFLEAPDWPAGMTAGDFEGFRDGLAADAEQALGRFCALVSQGSPSPRQVRREIQGLAWPDLSPARLRGHVQSLEWLAALDQRELWLAPEVHAHHLFGARDALVNARTPEVLGLAPERYSVFEDACHWPGTIPDVAGWIGEALEQVTP